MGIRELTGLKTGQYTTVEQGFCSRLDEQRLRREEGEFARCSPAMRGTPPIK